MKKLLVLAALVAAAAITQASVQSSGNDCQQNRADRADCQQTELATNGQCGGQKGRARNGNGNGNGEQRGQRGKKNKKGKQNRRGQGGQDGARGQCGGSGSALLTGGTTTASTGTVQVITPTLRDYLGTLQKTLEKELYARDYYHAADVALAGPPRFGNLAGAEQSHADAVANMITYLGGTPVMSHNIPIVIPNSVSEADDTCREIEIMVIRVYNGLIRSCPDPAILPTLNNIQAANYQHLSIVGG